MKENSFEINENYSKYLSPVLVILAASLWGIIGLFSRILLSSGLTPVQITASRCIVTALGMIVFLGVKDRDKLRIDLKDIWYFIGAGIFSFVFFNIFYFITIEEMTLSTATILLYTNPYYVVIISAFLFKERITKQKVLALILAFVGCIFTTGISKGGLSISSFGLITGLISGLFFGLYSIFGRIALKKYHPYTVTAYSFIVASIGILPFENIGDSFKLALGSSTVMLNILLLGLLCTMISFLLFTKGLQGMDTGKASVLTFVEPMVATIVGIGFFKEAMTSSSIIGIILIFISIILLNIKIGESRL